MLEREAKVDKSAWKGLASLIGSLPLESCTRENIPITKEWGWKAPKNKTFRITGHFVIDSDQSDIEYRYMPLQSVDILKEEHSKLYEEFLKESEGNENEALDLMVEDIFDGCYSGAPVNFFDGKWLVISPDLKQDFHVDKKDKLETPEIIVKSDIQTWADREYFQEISDVSPQSSVITSIFFDTPHLVEHWSQYFAQAVLGKCKIELIDSPEKEENLYIPKPKDDKTLYLPEGVRNANYDYVFSIRTRKRPDKKEEKQLEDFDKNSGLIFIHPWDSDLLIARRAKKVILPEKKKKITKDIPF